MTYNIYLIGMMGAGKTTIGRILGQRLGWSFYDSDEFIARRYRCSIAEFFKKEGEEAFRQLESNLIRMLVQKKAIVLATGGGAILKSENRFNLASTGRVVYLKASLSELIRRAKKSPHRPLLNHPNKATRLRDLSIKRAALYEEIADIICTTDRCKPQAVAELILTLGNYPIGS